MWMVPTLKTGSGYSNPQVDQLLDAAETEFDPAKRRDYAIQIQQLLMNDGAALFLGYPKTKYRYWFLLERCCNVPK